MSTSGWPFWSRSARVPESFRSAPVSSGTGRVALSGSNLNRYQVVVVGGEAFTPGQTTALDPHDVTTVCFGTPKMTYDGLAGCFFFFAGLDAETERALMPSRFAGFVSKSASRDTEGP